MRHDCSEGDGLGPYGWVEHDGRSYGKQDIEDKKAGVRLVTSMVKPAQLKYHSSSLGVGAGTADGEWVRWLMVSFHLIRDDLRVSLVYFSRVDGYIAALREFRTAFCTCCHRSIKESTAVYDSRICAGDGSLTPKVSRRPTAIYYLAIDSSFEPC